MLREVGLAASETTLVAVVQDVQVLNEETVEGALVEPHDTIVDHIVTPTRTIRTDTDPSRPVGIHWNLLTISELETIPPLKTLWRRAGTHHCGHNRRTAPTNKQVVDPGRC
jgi:5-formyltetrahydrofolate cyclo-ligase